MNWKRVAAIVFALLFVGFLAFCWNVGSGLKKDVGGNSSFTRIIPVALVGVYFSEHPNPDVEAKNKYCEENFGRPKSGASDEEDEARYQNYLECGRSIGRVVCDENADDYVSCVEKTAPTTEIKNACVAGEKAMQDLRGKILSSPDLLVGLAFVGPALGFRNSLLPTASGLAEMFGPPAETPAWTGIDLAGMHPAFVEAFRGLDSCLQVLDRYRSPVSNAKLVLPKMLAALGGEKNASETKRLEYYNDDPVTAKQIASQASLDDEIEFVCADEDACQVEGVINGENIGPAFTVKSGGITVNMNGKHIELYSSVCFDGEKYLVLVGHSKNENRRKTACGLPG